MLALIDNAFIVQSVHATLSDLTMALGRYHLQKQLIEQAGESASGWLYAVNLKTTRYVGDYCTPPDFVIITEFKGANK